ncbi:Connectin [Halotydeus destructor]|nr:Connectin [Halotydeus destructor]
MFQVVIFLFALLGQSLSLECPLDNGTAICSCLSFKSSNHESEIQIICDGLQVTQVTLQEYFQNLNSNNEGPSPQYNLESLQIVNTSLASLERNVFGNLTFQEIEIFSNQYLTDFNIDAILGSRDTLGSLYLQNSPLRESEKVLKHIKKFPNMESVHMNNVSLSAIPDNIFHCKDKRNLLTKLTTLDLSNNTIKTLGSKSFYPLASLERLVLDNNQICNISGDAFDMIKPENATDNDSQILVYLRNNNLESESFGQGSFQNTDRDSVVIFLNNNKIESLSENVFAPLCNVTEILVGAYHNPFVCDCRLSWLLKDPKNRNRYHGVICPDDISVFDKDPKELASC